MTSSEPLKLDRLASARKMAPSSVTPCDGPVLSEQLASSTMSADTTATALLRRDIISPEVRSATRKNEMQQEPERERDEPREPVQLIEEARVDDLTSGHRRRPQEPG